MAPIQPPPQPPQRGRDGAAGPAGSPWWTWVVPLRPDLDDALAVRLGGREAEHLVFGTTSTGAHDELITATELARKMVREWGMSEPLGHLAWCSQGAVFLGEDLLHTRDYSDDTARVAPIAALLGRLRGRGGGSFGGEGT